jgi:hypothetical protein
LLKFMCGSTNNATSSLTFIQFAFSSHHFLKFFFHCFCFASSIGVAWTMPFFWHRSFFMSFSFYIMKWQLSWIVSL